MHLSGLVLFFALLLCTSGNCCYAAFFGNVVFDSDISGSIEAREDNFKNYLSQKGEFYFWNGFKPLNMISDSEVYYPQKNKNITPLMQSIPGVYNISLVQNSVSQAAQKSWEELFLENKNRADFLYAYAMYLKTSQDYRSALSILDRAINIDPNYALGYFLKGDIYRLVGEYKKAVLAYISTIKINPYCTDAYFNIAKIFEEFNQIELALDYYRYAYSVSPNDIEIRNTIIRLQRSVPVGQAAYDPNEKNGKKIAGL